MPKDEGHRQLSFLWAIRNEHADETDLTVPVATVGKVLSFATMQFEHSRAALIRQLEISGILNASKRR